MAPAIALQRVDLPAPFSPTKRMHLAGIEIEIDVFDGVHAAIDLAAVDDAQHRLAADCRTSADGLGGVVISSRSCTRLRLSSSTRPLPFETITKPCDVSRAAVMP